MDNELDLYATLEVAPEASQAVIASAYRTLARRYHPDVASDAASASRMIDINAAWEVLRDARRRAAYDRRRALRQMRAHAETASAEASAMRARAGRPYAPGGHARDDAREPHWTGAGGPPLGRPSGTRLDFGIYKDWTLGQVARHDPGYLVWLQARREGRPFLGEIDAILRGSGVRTPDPAAEDARSGFFRRR